MYRENVPSRLRVAREKAGYTQQQIADETGIERTIISKIENGKQEPSMEQLAKLAQIYNVSTDWILGVVIEKTRLQ